MKASNRSNLISILVKIIPVLFSHLTPFCIFAIWQRFYIRFVVFRDNLFFLMKTPLALNTFLGKTVFFIFRFSGLDVGLPPASVKKEECYLFESKIILRIMFFKWIANEKSRYLGFEEL